MNELTCIIPFLNEGIEVFRTVKSIRETAGYDVDIILINDNSTDGVAYEVVAKKYNCKYVVNQTRQGVAGSRNLGVAMAKTDYCLLLDAHMRFYDTDWVQNLLEEVKKNKRKIYCTACVAIWYPHGGPSRDATIYSNGAYLATTFQDWHTSLDPKWIPLKFVGTEDVPLVLGATYCFHKDYYKELKGLEGLHSYGCDEAWISLKSWAIGDGCAVIPKVRIGHVFRDAHPYPIYSDAGAYNRFMMISVLFPDKKGWLTSVLSRSTDSILPLIRDNKHKIVELRAWFKDKEKLGWRDLFNELNAEFVDEGAPL